MLLIELEKQVEMRSSHFADGDELRAMLMGMKRFTKHEPFNVKDSRRVVAAKLIEKNEYCF